MKKIIISLVFVVLSISINAQSWQWAKAIGGTLDDAASCIIADASGNVYVSGSFNSTSIQFGSTAALTNASSGTKDIFLVKYDVSGNALWAVRAGGTGNDATMAMSIDATGNVYIAGSYYSSSIQFGTTNALANSGSEDIFIAKYDASGNALLAIKAGGSGQDCANGIKVDGSGNIYITGYFISPTITIGSTTLTNNGNKDVLIAKYNSAGVAQWAKSSGGTSHDWGIALTTDATGNVYVTGSFRSSAGLSFGSVTLAHVGYYDFFVLKFNSSGTALWGAGASGSGHIEGRGIVVDASGNSYITGTYDYSGVQFGSTPALTTNGMFLVKYNSTGTAQWARKSGGTSSNPYDNSNGIVIDASSNIYITGFFYSSTIVFGTTTLNNNIYSGYNESFIAKYDASGTVLWADKAGGTTYDQAYGIAIDASNNLYIAGSFDSQNMQFGSVPVVTNSGDFDIFVGKSGVSTITNSTAASTAIGNPSAICQGLPTTLSISGGSLGSSANWYWYSGACGTTLVGSGATYTVIPTSNTLYFVRAEGLGNTTTCVSTTIVVNTSSVQATSVSANPSVINIGSSSVLNITGGSLGTNANWKWYSNSCGVSLIASGISTTQNPTITTVYYVRAEGTCNTTFCTSTMVSVNTCTPSVSATSIVSSSLDICLGMSTTLVSSGGSLETGANWFWYSGYCGGTSMGSGLSLIVSPSLMFTTYYVRAEGQCNTTSCLSITITTNTISVAPAVVNATSSVSNGTNDTLTISSGILGSNSNWFWYSGTCGGTFLGNGDTLIINQTINSIYFVRAEGQCNTTNCAAIFIPIIPSAGNNISGIFTYSNTANTPLDSLWVSLVQNGNKLDSIQTDINGFYIFNNVSNGAYNIVATTHKAWGGVNITDVVKVKRHFSGAEPLTTSYKLHSADVNQTNFINISDAVKISRRFAGADTSFDRGDWVFEKTFGGDTINVSTYMNDTVIVNGANVTQDFKGICVGDVNGSYNSIPVGQKSLMIKNNIYNSVGFNRNQKNKTNSN